MAAVDRGCPADPGRTETDAPADRPTAVPEQVWYAAYGSNMAAARFACYVAGGRPEGADRDYPGCLDRRPPRRDRPITLPGGIYFAWESRTWTGGMAFYDPLLTGPTPARAYLVTSAQFLDITAQEMRRAPGAGATAPLAKAIADGGASLGPGRYETLICAGVHLGCPVLTFTAPWPADQVPWRAPSAAYLATIARGLREAHGWSTRRIVEYLSERPGIAGQWRHADLVGVVGASGR